MAINNKLLRLTKQEKRIVQERLGVSVPEAIHLLNEAWGWAIDHFKTTPEEFESRFPEFVAAYGLNNPVMADVVKDYVLSFVGSDEDEEADRRGFELMALDKSQEDWTEADEQVCEAFEGSCDRAWERATASEKLLTHNIIERGTPTTREELKEAVALAHLREWARNQIN